LARELRPKRILLAGMDEGVWEDFPQCTTLIPEITLTNWDQVRKVLSGSQATDVTGGMASKVEAMLDLIKEIGDLQVSIFTGETEGNIAKALCNQDIGTRILQD